MTRLRFFGVATLEIDTESGLRIIVDPFLDDNPASPVKAADLERVDLMLVTHASFDHYGQAPDIAKRFGCPVVCGSEVKALLLDQGVKRDQLIGLTWGLRAEVLGVGVQAVESHHWSFGVTKSGDSVCGPALGLVVFADPDLRLYINGDTALFDGLKLIGRLYRPNIGLVPVAIPDLPGVQPAVGRLTRGMMSPEEAVLASQWLGLEYVIPCHFIDPDCPEVAEFVGALGRLSRADAPRPRLLLLRPGESHEFESL
ncbi:MAG: MBL fold metallo-hydrolase [Chloroflexi bacterium]|nr:MBL fold metallo-hydrolase [Chloroflexota bacterium]MCL5108689.1 MBL fold metallo-hydrolase [Chloroflexota bacterium]